MIAESFFTLLRDPGHWGFELFLMAIFDGLIGLLIWPRIKSHIHRDVAGVDDETHHIDGEVHRMARELNVDLEGPEPVTIDMKPLPADDEAKAIELLRAASPSTGEGSP